MRDKFNVLHEDKGQIFLEADIIDFDGHCQVSPKDPKQQVCSFTKFTKSLQYLKREIRAEFIFVQINIKVFNKLVLLHLIIAGRHP